MYDLLHAVRVLISCAILWVGDLQRGLEAVGPFFETVRQTVGTVVQNGLECARTIFHAAQNLHGNRLSRRSAQKVWGKGLQHFLRFAWCFTLACIVATAALVIFPGTCVYVLTSSAAMYTQLGWVSTVVLLDILTILLMGAIRFWSMIQSFVTTIASSYFKNRSQQTQRRPACSRNADNAAWKLGFNSLEDSALLKLTTATFSVAAIVLNIFKVRTAFPAAAQSDLFMS